MELKKLQKYYRQKAQERGFADESPRDIMLLFTEELGELARAVRKISGIKIDGKAKIPEVEEELADLLIYIIHLANQLNIDLEKAFKEKEKLNKSRIWRKMK